MLPVAVLAVILVLWELLVKLKDIKEYILPSPSAIAREFVVSFNLLVSHTAITLVETITGFIIGLITAVFLSLLLDKFMTLKMTVYPYLIVTQTIPLVALAPILAIWFGFGLLPKIILSVLVVFFPITLSLTEGLSSYDRDLYEMMTQMGASKKQIFLKLKIPSASVHFFSGLKIAAAYCVMGAVISEWVGAQKGLGIFLTRAMSSFQTAALFADIIIIIVISLVLFKTIQFIEKKTIRWRTEK
ncbi:MAG: ABC transporter permease [Clostridia bacterium]|nr:ABC transporter permease [Clostridia bacterium]